MRRRTGCFICLIAVFGFLYFIILVWNPKTVRYNWFFNSALEAVDVFPFDEVEYSADKWTCIGKTACVYSAYWDDRFKPSRIRIVAIVPKGIRVSSWKCLLKYNTTTLVVPLEKEAIPEGHGQDHEAAFFLCSAKDRPEGVNVLIGSFNSSFIEVKSTGLVDTGKGKLAVCVRPFYGSFGNNNSLIAEFLAYYQQLGVDHFTFYDYKSDLGLKDLLNELMEDGFPIDFIPWNLPENFHHAWCYGQMAFSADCVYRNSREYEFVATVDIDEFIVPKDDISLKDVIEKASPKTKFGTYIFRQTFFCMEYENDPSSVNLTIPLVTQAKTKHEEKIWPHNQRSKAIVRPVAIVTPGIHFTWTHLKGWKAFLVSNDVALLHHYRSKICQNNNTGVIEQRTLRYRERILNSQVIQVWGRLYL